MPSKIAGTTDYYVAASYTATAQPPGSTKRRLGAEGPTCGTRKVLVKVRITVTDAQSGP